MPVVIPDGLEKAWTASADGFQLRVLEPLLSPWDPMDWEVVDAVGNGQLSLFSAMDG